MKITFVNFWQNWKRYGGYIGDFQSRLFLTVFYFTVMVPFGLLVRLLRDPLHLRKQITTSTWVKGKAKGTDLNSSRYQF